MKEKIERVAGGVHDGKSGHAARESFNILCPRHSLGDELSDSCTKILKETLS